ncbi:MAG: ATP-binding cassette domain-containing protein [Deltaproteobacteria bacterium]|nr:MAG: ATP-binding cassette domain-containing protein [Deltaproteobacteria bacterium]
MGSIELDKITFSYGAAEDEPLFVDFSLKISAGEWVAVMGPSGAGKTTLLKLIKGLLRPQRGEIRVDSNVLPAGALNHFAACVFANPENQIVSPVVAEDVAFALENMGVAPEIISSRVEEALRWVGLWHRARDFSHHLSGGEQQRLILAGALAQRKSCLLLDDPLSMVGGRSRAEMLSLLKRIHGGASSTMLHTTHLLEDAFVAQRLIALERGGVVFDGSPYDFLQEEELIEQLGLEVPAIAQLVEMLTRSGLAEPGEVTSLEQLSEVLTVSEHRTDNETE